ncbi:MAG TPA: AMIN domain-containing protein [Candidatus Sulfotelmatobacter sp.]|nr:AMIN domain-containing protein [Candidatus Sulfotelmatobacter sp.]
MKLTTGILAIAMMAGGPAALVAVGQNPDAIDNARSVAKSLQQKQANDTNAALNAAGVPAPKPAAGAPAPSVKPAVIPGSSQASASPAASAKPAAKPAAPAKVASGSKSQAASSQNNKLEHVNVVPGGNDIQVEITSTSAVTPKVSKLSSPARVLVEFPETVVATSQNKIPVGSAGVKGVRIGMDGKNPPTTSVVVDLDKALPYDISSGPAGKFALILHTQGGAPAVAAKSAPAPAKAAPVAMAKSAPAAAPKTVAPTAKSAPAAKAETKTVASKTPAPKTAIAAPKKEAKQDVKIAAAKPAATKAAPSKAAPVVAAAPAEVKPAEPAKPKAEEKKWAMSGKRDPFFSPVVQQQGSGCASGKKCLEIGNINLRGVVKSDTGFIAVVTNNIGKAYFLRENDPVFNGYVVKITGDSVVFQETVQDKLGKSTTREVVKRIFTPAV